jgi:CO dehydrogenase/acetyl-CoA synthase epsilon subunit
MDFFQLTFYNITHYPRGGNMVKAWNLADVAGPKHARVTKPEIVAALVKKAKCPKCGSQEFYRIHEVEKVVK